MFFQEPPKYISVISKGLYYRPQRDNKGEEIINMTSGNKHPKFFSKEDGEYVDFEEINE